MSTILREDGGCFHCVHNLKILFVFKTFCTKQDKIGLLLEFSTAMENSTNARYTAYIGFHDLIYCRRNNIRTRLSYHYHHSIGFYASL